MTYRLFLVGLLPICLTLQIAQAQSTFADLRGATRDPSGLRLDHTVVTVHSVEQNNDRKLVSGDDGSFAVETLLSGRYELTAVKAGFQASETIKVELSARQSLRVDLTVALETQGQTVEVSSAVAQVNTENAVLGDSKVTDQIAQLPLNFRAVASSPLAALATSPNVQQDSQGNLALNGGTGNTVGFSLDGISTANVVQSEAGVHPYPSVEGIAEMKVTAFNNSAEFSQVGDVTFTTKGGSNDFHGSAFEYLQNRRAGCNRVELQLQSSEAFQYVRRQHWRSAVDSEVLYRAQQNFLLFRL
jgi:hypothetical protein